MLHLIQFRIFYSLEKSAELDVFFYNIVDLIVLLKRDVNPRNVSWLCCLCDILESSLIGKALVVV